MRDNQIIFVKYHTQLMLHISIYAYINISIQGSSHSPFTERLKGCKLVTKAFLAILQFWIPPELHFKHFNIWSISFAQSTKHFFFNFHYCIWDTSHFCGLIVLHKKLLNSWFVHSFFSSIKALYLHSICSIFASYHTSSSRVLPTTNAPSKDTFAFWRITCRKLDL